MDLAAYWKLDSTSRHTVDGWIKSEGFNGPEYIREYRINGDGTVTVLGINSTTLDTIERTYTPMTQPPLP